MGLLPYVDPSALSLFLQDEDTSVRGNLPVQILTKLDWIGRKIVRWLGRGLRFQHDHR